MKQLSTGLCKAVILLLSCLLSCLGTVQGQTVTVTGTVLAVLPKAGVGMIVGSHLLLATQFGEVDASLGRYGLQGAGALAVEAGQQIEASGIMKTIQNTPVLLVRSLKVGAEVYRVRNQHGVPLSPQARERVRQAGERSEAQ